MNNRRDNTRDRQEDFAYDNLNRLRIYSGINVAYDQKGNITDKSDVGTAFVYNTPNKPYAISAVRAGGGIGIPVRNQWVTYTSFDRPSSITENNTMATFTYNASSERVKMDVVRNGVSELTRYYLGGRYETESQTGIERLYLGGDAYSAPAVYVKEGSEWNIYYICRDYLGSITHIANANGTVKAEYSYDPWGQLRNPVTQANYGVEGQPSLFLGRGYTGHEHLPWFGLVNMNARLYDPMLGRFLSPDPYVQAPDFTQNFNRYSYCLNNPLRYVDENGEVAIIVPIIIGAVIGMYAGGVMANNGEYNPFQWDYSSGKTWGYMIGGSVVGGVAGVAGAAVGAVVAGTAFVSGLGGFAAGAMVGAAAGATGGFITGFGMDVVSGAPLGGCFFLGGLYFIGGLLLSDSSRNKIHYKATAPKKNCNASLNDTHSYSIVYLYLEP